MDPQTREALAVKVVSGSCSSSRPALRWEMERTAMARCGSHPHVVGLRYAAACGGDPSKRCIVMELADASLDRVLKAFVGDEAMVLLAAHDLLQALRHLHGLGILHRDVKPANVMVHMSGALKLGDFGLAAVLGPDMWLRDRPNSVVTVNYRCPELLLGCADQR